ncbi:MAG: hypothetical protein HKL83_01430 [Acidimicrobiaceae bacterium]|nr:hypothetical protein [Acidimicrobiaceae bacterium]
MTQEEGPAYGPEGFDPRGFVKDVVYFSVGVTSALAKAVPTAAKDGERIVAEKIQSAEMVGRLTVGFLRHSYGPKVDEVVSGVKNLFGGAPGGRREDKGRDGSADSTQGEPKPSQSAANSGVVGTIANYDQLTAAQVIRHLELLGEEELAEVEGYELAGRRRRTILNRLSEIRENRIAQQGD